MSKVRDVMTKTVVTAGEDSTFRELVGTMHEWRVSALPVVDPTGSIVGVVSEADLLLKEDPQVLTPHFIERRARRLDRGKALAVIARDLMTTPAVTVEPDAPLAVAAHVMHERGVKRLFVTDPEGTVLGVVSRVDLLRAFLRGDAEISADVDQVLLRELRLPPDAIHAEVNEGIVVLDGCVERRTLAPDAVTHVRTVEGVIDVVDRLTWDYDDTVAAGYGAGWVGF